jgi:hypothetical protein
MDLSVDFQQRQERASRVEQFQTTDWAIDFGEANVRTRVRGVLVGQWGSFCLSLGPGAASWNSQAAGAGTAGLLPPGEEVDGRTTADYAWLTAAVTPGLWRRCLTLAGVAEDGLRRVAVCPLPAPVFGEIERRLRAVHRLMRQAADFPCCRPGAIRDAAAFVTDSFTILCGLAARTKPPHDSLRNRVRLVRRADAWLNDHLSEPVQVPDLLPRPAGQPAGNWSMPSAALRNKVRAITFRCCA